MHFKVSFTTISHRKFLQQTTELFLGCTVLFTWFSDIANSALIVVVEQPQVQPVSGCSYGLSTASVKPTLLLKGTIEF
jgi:hypothetical protein